MSSNFNNNNNNSFHGGGGVLGAAGGSGSQGSGPGRTRSITEDSSASSSSFPHRSSASSSFSVGSFRAPDNSSGTMTPPGGPEWGAPEWSTVAGRPLSPGRPMSPMSGYEESRMFTYSPNAAASMDNNSNNDHVVRPTGFFRTPIEGMEDINVSQHDKSNGAVDADGEKKEKDGLLKSGFLTSGGNRFLNTIRHHQHNRKKKTDESESDDDDDESAKDEEMARRINESIAKGYTKKGNPYPATEKSHVLLCGGRNRCSVICLVLALIVTSLATVSIVAKGRQVVANRSQSSNNSNSTDSDGESLGDSDGGATPDDLCDFTGILQPNVFRQCDCRGRIDVFSSDTLSRYKDMKQDLVTTNVLTSEAADQLKLDSCEPANQALAWLATDRYPNRLERRERYALAILYAAWSGLHWRRGHGDWVNQTHSVCDWDGITCQPKTGTVEAIMLNDNNMIGTIPKEITLLTDLRSVAIAYNHIEGTFPVELTTMTSLQAIRFSVNFLRGTIPKELANMVGLKSLQLDFNGFTGTFPTELTTLPQLDHFGVWDNKLSGTLPTEIGRFRNIRELKFHSNLLEGTIPTEIGKLSSIVVLNMARNNLKGTIPSEIGHLESLQSLDLADLGLDGTIPTEIGDCRKLETLAVSDNQLSGTLPTEFGQLQHMEYLYIIKTQVNGPIPAEFGQMGASIHLRLQNNQLTGTVPNILARLSDLEMLDVTGNNLKGTMPSELCIKAQTNFIKKLYSDCTVGALECKVPDCCTDCAP